MYKNHIMAPTEGQRKRARLEQLSGGKAPKARPTAGMLGRLMRSMLRFRRHEREVGGKTLTYLLT